MFLTLYSKTDPIETLALIRYYWGWILFYVFFSVGFRININLVLKVLSLAVLGEAILINTIFPASFWPNYPEAASHIIAAGHYQRPYSFGGNASVTSVILLSLFVCSQLSRRASLLPIAAILSCMSGSGLFLFAGYLLYRCAKKDPLLSTLHLIVFLGILSSNTVRKFSFEYSDLIYNYKIYQIDNSGVLNSFQAFLLALN